MEKSKFKMSLRQKKLVVVRVNLLKNQKNWYTFDLCKKKTIETWSV